MAKKGTNIYKRKDKRWEARYIKGYSPSGKACYGYCYGKTYREAKEKAELAKASLLMQGPTAEAGRHRKFSDYCEEWLQVSRIKVKESTLAKYTTTVERHIIPQLGGCLVQALSTATVERFTQELLYEQELSPKTVKDILIILRAILQYASRQYPGAFPQVDIYYPKETRKEMRVLTKDEQKQFIQYLFKEMDECKFGTLLALLTGMRIGEICALRWENISLTEGTIKVDSTMQRLKNLDAESESKTKIILSQPKSDTSARVIPLNETVIQICRKFQVACPAAFVLTGSAEKVIEPRLLQYKMDKYTRECGLKGVHFHTLRHTFATRCVEVGFEMKSLSEILGHSSPRITLERYVHSSMELKRENMKRLAMLESC